MSDFSRRDFLTNSAKGFAVVGGAGFLLAPDALPTEGSGELGNYGRLLAQETGGAPARVPVLGNPMPASWNPTEPNILGPFHRPGSPFRAKITPPLEPGNVLLISGRVWAQDTRRPLANAVMDIWQANASGRYDNDDPNSPPAPTVFKNRARMMTDENGYYEFETIHPAPYQIGDNRWRPSHIHYWVRVTNYRDLVTQLYFRGDRHNATDAWIRPTLIIDLQEQRVANNARYHSGSFDIVLRRAG